MPKAKATAEQFVEVWQKSDSIEAVAKKLGIKVASAKAKASAYRRRQIGLKKFPSVRGAKPLDVAALAKLASTLSPKKEKSAASTKKSKRAKA